MKTIQNRGPPSKVGPDLDIEKQNQTTRGGWYLMHNVVYSRGEKQIGRIQVRKLYNANSRPSHNNKTPNPLSSRSSGTEQRRCYLVHTHGGLESNLAPWAVLSRRSTRQPPLILRYWWAWKLIGRDGRDVRYQEGTNMPLPASSLAKEETRRHCAIKV